MLMLKHDNKTEITNAIATNFTSIGNIIPDFDKKFTTDPSKKEDLIIIPQKIGEKLFLSQKQKNIITVMDIGEIDSLSEPSGRDNNFNVIAIINSTGNPIIDNSVFIETKKGKEILNKSDDYDILFLTYDDINKVDSIVNTLQKHFNNQITILNSLEIMRTLTKFIVGVSTFISSIAVFSLIVGAIGIVITIYTSVVERTREIGILKALGGTNRTILSMFLTESVIIGTIGAGIGILIGFLGSYVLLNAFLFFLKIPIKVSPVFDLIEILKIFTVVVGLSIFSGLYPAYRGSKISPVNALNKYY
jgi:putative ABC transport system permease protein